MEVVAVDMIMGDGYYEFENSGCSSTSTIQDEIDCNWNNWAPIVDWDPLSSGPDDFHGLIESMMLDNEPLSSMMRCDYDYLSPPQLNVGEGEDEDKELRLVHLLVAAAEALSGPHKSRELTCVILVRLRELVPPAAASNGTNMQRLAAHFTDALQSLLDGPPTGPTGTTRSNGGFHHHHHHRDDDHHPGDVLMAIQLLQDMAPYVKFGHFTANQAILEAISGDRRVHIIDYDIMEGVQWASLMQALVTQKDGPPLPHLRITAITGHINSGGGGKKSTGTIHETGRRLAAFAASIGQPFSFGQCRLDSNEKLRSSGIKLVKGETLIANCVLHPPHFPQRSATSVGSFLIEAATLGAKLVTLVEEEEGETRKGEDKDRFVGRFIDELYRYSAIWDSLEAGFPMQGRARGLVERVILGPRIGSAVKRAYWREKDGEKGGGEGRWGDWMSRMGFKRAGISFFNHCQAKLLLGLFNDGYKVEEDAANKLVLGWKSRRLITASVWSSPPPSPTPSTSSSGFTS